MNKRTDELDIPRMVPERDEVVSRSSGHSGQRKSASGSSSNRSGGGVGGGTRFLLFILTLGLFATVAAGYLFYSEGQRALAELEDTNMRLMALEERLSAVGENTEETTLNMVERLDSNFSEIDKLWAARNTNVENIESNTSSIEEIEELLASMEQAVESHASSLNRNTSQLDNMQSRLNSITSNISSMENLDRELTLIKEQLSEAEASLEALRPLGERVGTAEQDIESINVYRLQLNQTISTLQDQIRNLQQRVGR